MTQDTVRCKWCNRVVWAKSNWDRRRSAVWCPQCQSISPMEGEP